jgi:hypothetical protein
MEAATPVANEGRGNTGGLYHANQVAAFDYSERQATFSARVLKCIVRAFDATGTSSITQETIFWKLQTSRNIARDEIIDKPAEFLEGLKTIFGEAGVVVFEYMMTREIKREFGLTAKFDKEPIKARDLADLLHLIAYTEVESHGNP